MSKPQRMVPRGLSPEQAEGYQDVLTREESALVAARRADEAVALACMQADAAIETVTGLALPATESGDFRGRAFAYQNAARALREAAAQFDVAAGELHAEARRL